MIAHSVTCIVIPCFPGTQGEMVACMEPVCPTNYPLLCQSHLQHWLLAHAWYVLLMMHRETCGCIANCTNISNPGALLLCSGMAVFQLQWSARRCGPVAPGASLLDTLSEALARGPGYVAVVRGMLYNVCILHTRSPTTVYCKQSFNGS